MGIISNNGGQTTAGWCFDWHGLFSSMLGMVGHLRLKYTYHVLGMAYHHQPQDNSEEKKDGEDGETKGEDEDEEEQERCSLNSAWPVCQHTHQEINCQWLSHHSYLVIVIGHSPAAHLGTVQPEGWYQGLAVPPLKTINVWMIEPSYKPWFCILYSCTTKCTCIHYLSLHRCHIDITVVLQYLDSRYDAGSGPLGDVPPRQVVFGSWLVPWTAAVNTCGWCQGPYP